MREGWKCPNCGKAHGPHVDTCPETVSPIAAPQPVIIPTITYQTPKLPLCGCEPGTACANVACPHRTVVTCDASNAAGVN